MSAQFQCANNTLYQLRFCNVYDQSECASMNEAIAVTPKITSMMSIIGVSLIIYRFFLLQPRMRKTYDRLLLGMSIMNFWGSIGFFLGQWTYPSIPQGAFNSPFCSWQGWLLQINSAVFWYNGVLATNFVMRIKLGWSEDKVRKIEPWMHFVAWFYPTTTAFIALGLNMYSRSGPWCWISVTYDWARWAFFFAWLWLIMIYSAACMIIIVVTVKKSDEQTAHIRDTQSSNGKKGKRLGKKTREVAVQAILYVGTFLLTWVFGTANRIQNAIVAAAYPDPYCNIFALVWLHSFFVPLQGFFNFVVYIYPRVKDSQKKKSARITAKTAGLGEVSTLRLQWIKFVDFMVQSIMIIFACDRSDSSESKQSSQVENQRSRSRKKKNEEENNDKSTPPSQAPSGEVPSELKSNLAEGNEESHSSQPQPKDDDKEDILPSNREKDVDLGNGSSANDASADAQPNGSKSNHVLILQ